MEGSLKKNICFVFGYEYKESLTFKTLHFKPTTSFGNKKKCIYEASECKDCDF